MAEILPGHLKLHFDLLASDDEAVGRDFTTKGEEILRTDSEHLPKFGRQET